MTNIQTKFLFTKKTARILFIVLGVMCAAFQTVTLYADVVSAARQAVKKNASDSNTHFNLGLAIMQSKETELRAGKLGQSNGAVKEAEAEYKKAIKLSKGTHGRANIMLGMLYTFTGRDKQAVEYLKKGMELPAGSPDWNIAANTLVNAYFNQNLTKPAIPVLNQLIKHNPEDASVHYKLGLCYMFNGQKKDAIAAYEKTLDLDPEHADAKKYLDQLQADN